jgi:hypothetical protein
MTRANPLLEVLLAAARGELPANAYVFCANPKRCAFIRQWRTATLWMPR